MLLAFVHPTPYQFLLKKRHFLHINTNWITHMRSSHRSSRCESHCFAFPSRSLTMRLTSKVKKWMQSEELFIEIYEYCMRAVEQKVSGQAYFQIPIHSPVFLLFSEVMPKKTNFSHCQENLTLSNFKRTDESREWRQRHWYMEIAQCCRDREGGEGWITGSQWWNSKLIWNNFEVLAGRSLHLYHCSR